MKYVLLHLTSFTYSRIHTAEIVEVTLRRLRRSYALPSGRTPRLSEIQISELNK